MASIERMFKMMLEEIHNAAIPINSIVQNQEIMIIQNKQIIELLEQLRVSADETNE